MGAGEEDCVGVYSFSTSIRGRPFEAPADDCFNLVFVGFKRNDVPPKMICLISLTLAFSCQPSPNSGSKSHDRSDGRTLASQSSYGEY